MGFLLFSAGCSEGFLVAAIDLNRLGGSGEPPLPLMSQRVLFWGFLLGLVEVVQGGPYSEVRALSQSSRIKSIIIFYFLRGGRITDVRILT